jgi:hypothetical protein
MLSECEHFTHRSELRRAKHFVHPEWRVPWLEGILEGLTIQRQWKKDS